MSFETFQLKRTGTSDRKLTADSAGYAPGDELVFGTPVEVEFPIAVHPNDNGIIIVHYPGKRENIDGYSGKFRTLANHMQEQGLGAVVRAGNELWKWFEYWLSMKDDFRKVMDYTLEHAEEICGRKTPRVYLMAHCAGTHTVSTIAHEYSEVEKLLLTGPSYGNHEDDVRENLGKFTGEVYIALGDNDYVMDGKAGQAYFDRAVRAKDRQLLVIPDCDHMFKGERSGRIMSQLPFWAFLNGNQPPPIDPAKGIKLYD